LYDLVEELSRSVKEWEPRVSQVITSAVKRTFSASEDMALETQSKIFLRWLGFSPVDVWWSEDVRVGRIYLGTSRLWKGDLADSTNERLRTIVQAIVKGMGQAFLGGESRVDILKDVDLPTRHTLCIQFSEMTTIPTSKKLKEEKLTLGVDLVEPFLGKAVSSKEGLDTLIDASISWLKEEESEVYRLYENDLLEVPLKSLYIAHKMGVDRGREEEFAWKIGKRFHSAIEDITGEAAPHQLIKGLGLLPPDQITELIFYCRNPSMCQPENIQFTQFLSKIWEKYLGEVLGKPFFADKPVRAAGSGNLCLFSFSSSK